MSEDGCLFVLIHKQRFAAYRSWVWYCCRRSRDDGRVMETGWLTGCQNAKFARGMLGVWSVAESPSSGGGTGGGFDCPAMDGTAGDCRVLRRLMPGKRFGESKDDEFENGWFFFKELRRCGFVGESFQGAERETFLKKAARFGEVEKGPESGTQGGPGLRQPR